jgi:hypothetical protein
MLDEMKSRFFSGKRFLVILVMLIAINANAQWVQINNGLPVIYNNEVNAIIVCDNKIIIGGDAGVYYSSNNGNLWIQSSLGRHIFSFAINGNNLFAGTDMGLYISTNNGMNWTQTGMVSYYAVYALTVSGDRIYAGTNSYGLLYSTNNGTNWIGTSLSNYTNGPIYSIYINGDTIFVGAKSNAIYISTNNGINWINKGLIYPTNVNDFLKLGNNIFAATSRGIYLTTNNGTNWNSYGLSGQPVTRFAISGNNIFAGINANGVYLSTNGGVNWIQKNQGFIGNPAIYSFLIYNNYIFAGTYGYSIWRRSLSEITGIQNISTETSSKYSLSQNYPNPFNPTTNIKFSIVNSGDVKLVVYDIMGKEVQTLVNERLQPGTYEATFGGSMLNSGVYFYKLITNSFTETKKMLMIK